MELVCSSPTAVVTNSMVRSALVEDQIMPVHDWTRVPAGIFHDFHQSWVIRLRDSLNEGRLPAGYYALAEQRTGGREPDVVTLESFEPTSDWTPSSSGGGTTVLAKKTKPPQVRFTAESDENH